MMKSRRNVLQGLAALACCPAWAASREASAQVVDGKLNSVQADSFVEFISVQTHLNWRESVWEQSAWRPLLGDLGIRYTRSALGTPMAREHLNALHGEYGIRSSATFNAIDDDGSFKLDATNRILSSLQEKVGLEKIYAIEGPNEYTHKYKTEGWAGRLRDYQAYLFNAVKSEYKFENVSVLAPTIWKRIVEDYEAIGDISAYADFGNLHLYNAGRKPSVFNREEVDTSIDVALDEAQLVTPGRKICVTETGFNVADGAAPTRWTVPPDIAAKYSLRCLAELFLRRDRVERVNLYSLIDDEKTDDHYGLLDASLNPRPAYWALRNLVRLIKDPGPAFAPETLECKLTIENPDLRWLLMQKRDKRFILMLWLDATSYDRRASVPLQVAPSPASVDFGRNVSSVIVHTPAFKDGAPQESINISTVSVEVPDHPLLLEIAL